MKSRKRLHALGLALAAIAARLKPDEAEPLDGSIVDAIQGGGTLHWCLSGFRSCPTVSLTVVRAMDQRYRTHTP